MDNKMNLLIAETKKKLEAPEPDKKAKADDPNILT